MQRLQETIVNLERLESSILYIMEPTESIVQEFRDHIYFIQLCIKRIKTIIL